jgi:hypothetical protein
MQEEREIKPNEGKAWKNADKTEVWHGDYKGTFVMPDGTKHFLDIYVNKKPDGEPWFKLRVGKAKISGAGAVPQFAAAQPESKAVAKPDLDDDIPF